MKLATFQANDGTPRIGAVVDHATRIVDLQSAHEHRYGSESAVMRSMQELIEDGDAGLDMAMSLARNPGCSLEAVRPVQGVRLLAPVPVQIRDCLCFEQHLVQAYGKASEVRAAQSPDPVAALREMEERKILTVPEVFCQRPIYYKANRFSVIGPDVDVIWPDYSKVRDFELEFGFFVKNRTADISKHEAVTHVFGYTIFNDFTARDEQVLEMSGQLGPAKGKDFDTGNAMGPWIVTADKLRDPCKSGDGRPGERRVMVTRFFQHNVLEIRGSSELRLTIGNIVPGRKFRLGHHREWIRPGDDAVSAARRCGRTRSRADRNSANRIVDRPRSGDKSATS